MARVPRGVQLQLFDLQTDPQEKVDLLHASGMRKNGSRQWEGPPEARALLKHYLSAVRVARKATQLAYSEGRLKKGRVQKVWFCRQVFTAWDRTRWSGTYHPMTCQGRREQLSRLVER